MIVLESFNRATSYFFCNQISMPIVINLRKSESEFKRQFPDQESDMKKGQRELVDLEDLLHRGFRYALSLCHDESLSEDLVQDACMKIVSNKKNWSKGLLFTIIRNRFIDLYRHSKKLHIHSVEEDKGKKRSMDWSVKRDTETDIANMEALDWALSRIRHDQREALYLSVVEGYTAQEISQLIDAPRNTVLSHIHRARKKLASLLSQREEKLRRSHE